MTRNEAKIIRETITNEQLKVMFDNAKNSITDWTKRSSLNKGMTKGAAWNIFGYDFDVNDWYHRLIKLNMLIEFGDYLPEELKIQKTPKSELDEPFHEEPKFK